MTPAAGEVVAGRWRLLAPGRAVLGGSAWVAHDAVLDRRVALELAAVDPPSLRAAARVAHPHLVPLFDTGVDALPYTVRAICPGALLADVLHDGPLDVPAALRLGAQLADALAAVHAAGLVHGAVDEHVVWWDGERAHLDGLGRGAAAGPDADVRAAGAVIHAALCGRGVPADVPARRVRAGIPRPAEDAVRAAVAGRVDAAGLRDALAAIELDDDAVPGVAHDPTPPRGTPPTPRHARRGAAPFVVAGVLAVALAVVAATLTRTRDDGAPARAVALRAAAVRSLDPVDPGGEREEALPLAVDGDAATSWRTERYRGRADLGGLKPGVGVVVELGGTYRVHEVRVASPTEGWSAAVYVAPRAAPDVAAWGEPVDARDAIGGDATFDVGGREAGAVLLWITRLGPVPGGFATEVSEISVTGSR